MSWSISLATKGKEKAKRLLHEKFSYLPVPVKALIEDGINGIKSDDAIIFVDGQGHQATIDSNQQTDVKLTIKIVEI